MIASIRVDIGRKLGLHYTRVIVLSLQIGSLVVDVEVTSDDVLEPELADAAAVAEKLKEPDSFPSTGSTYVAAGGITEDDVSVASAAVTNDGINSTPEPVAPAPTTPAPSARDSTAGGACSRGCQILLLVTVVVVGAIVTALSCACTTRSRRPSRSKREPYDGDGNCVEARESAAPPTAIHSGKY